MTINYSVRQLFFVIILTLFSSFHGFSQCFQIQSILVDACGEQEGLNEMVRFKVGTAALNTNNLTVEWPNNPWQGLIKNSVTAAKVATLNADIIAAGGCGQLIEPTAGVLPANATVILVTSYNLDPALNSFGALADTIYIIFQNNANTINGHFANYGTNGTLIRTLDMSFGSCSDTVSYSRALLVTPTGTNAAADGATVVYTPTGTANYINNGCSAPVQPFTVDAGPATLSACTGTTLALTGIAEGQQSVTWSAPSGTFSSPTTLATNYTINAAPGTTVTLTLTVTNSCGATITDTIVLTVNNGTTPTFTAIPAFCAGSVAPVLPTISTNGITGTWSPSTVSNTIGGTYTFTPTAGQCASAFSITTTVNATVTPTFTAIAPFCSGTTAPVLPTTSTNGITGTWSPATVSNTAGSTYTFTPTAGQCASAFSITTTVNATVTPTFAAIAPFCSGTTAPVLPTTSTNGITGTWSPATVSNTAGGTYTFTPTAGQCATPLIISITVSTGNIAPVFSPIAPFCNGSTAPVLPTISTNGITGTWSPATVSNTAGGSYTFTPAAGQCAVPLTINITVNPSVTPDFPAVLTACEGILAFPTLEPVSNNGITGSWNPSVITTEGFYVFTPDPGQCATAFTTTFSFSKINFELDQRCIAGKYIIQVAPLSASFDLNNVTYIWNDPNGNTVGNDENALNVTDLLNATPAAETFPITYTLTVRTPEGCELTQPAIVYGIFCSIPKGISPNGDTKNDSFDLTGLGVKDIVIFNRYGTKVYSRHNYTNEWKGQTDNGKTLPDATYFYVISKDNGESVTGWVYINK